MWLCLQTLGTQTVVWQLLGHLGWTLHICFWVGLSYNGFKEGGSQPKLHIQIILKALKTPDAHANLRLLNLESLGGLPRPEG